jgi:hypothetical protein
MAVNLPEPVWTQMQMWLVWRQSTSREEPQVSLSPILSEPAYWLQEQASLPEPLGPHPEDPRQAAHHSEDTAE